jgi:DNA-directed RNA polymerase specialized sigma24 family protein
MAMARDAFPTTPRTWIDEKLSGGEPGRRELNRHLMSFYAQPLQVYFRGSSWRWLGEADDVVRGFFADRLARAGFFRGWSRSGKPLRRWLLNAFQFYLKEERRRRQRERRTVPLSEEASAGGASVEEAFDRALARTMVRQALEEARRASLAAGLEGHWQAFVGHFYDGRRYEELGAELGVGAARAAVMARTAGKRFRAALRTFLLRDGVREERIEEEIAAVLAVTAR